ncbi:DUF4870 domain-containing protein [Lutibacter sp.]|uniref:DUF4870 domain-containing protein n=1 Tax=Lutibacter sp. TaxID=1925666 RepID=UPI0035696DE4
MDNYTVKEGKTMAIISYITWIGTLIAYFMNNEKRNSFASFHIRQAIGISLFSLVNSVFLLKYIGFYAAGFISLGLLILLIIGLIGAAQGEQKKIPLFGDLFQDWFKGIA